jgi:hypothetical protein
MHTTRTAGTADLGLLLRPAATYRVLSRSHTGTRVLNRLFVFVLVLGCTLSFLASGRLGLRLIADGAISFAFAPAFTVLGFAAVYFSRADRPLPFIRSLDLFLTGLLPWLLWLIGLSTISSIVPPRQLGPWLWPLEASFLLPAVWTCVIDFHFFREVMTRSSRAAIRDLLLHRIVAWGSGAAYFLGIAIWYEIVPVAVKWARG